MNPISNSIEIINFDELNENEQSIDLEQETGFNYINNCIVEKYNSEYSENQSDLNINESNCNISFFSDNNSIFSNHKINFNGNYPNLSYTEHTAYSESLKSNSFSESFSNLDIIRNNSFSYLTDKFKFSCDGKLKNSNLCRNNSANRIFACTFETCEKVYKSKENRILHYKNIHLNEKPYSCGYCNSRFSHRNGKKTINYKIFLFLK